MCICYFSLSSKSALNISPLLTHSMTWDFQKSQMKLMPNNVVDFPTSRKKKVVTWHVFFGRRLFCQAKENSRKSSHLMRRTKRTWKDLHRFPTFVSNRARKTVIGRNHPKTLGPIQTIVFSIYVHIDSRVVGQVGVRALLNPRVNYTAMASLFLLFAHVPNLHY